ncbi:MAG: energy transducer TonB [Fibrobacterota bacterium]
MRRTLITKADPQGKGVVISFVLISVIFHLFIIGILPLLLQLLQKEKSFERPKTFNLLEVQPLPEPEPESIEPEPVQEDVPREEPEPEPVEEEVSSVEPEPVPETPPKPQEETVVREEPPAEETAEPEPEKEEDLSDLESLFAEKEAQSAASVSEISTVENFQYDWYLNSVENMVQRNWRPTVRDGSLQVVLQFTIDRDGKYSSVRIVESSGNSVLDRQARRAVENVGRFNPLPPGYREQKLRINYTLIPDV